MKYPVKPVMPKTSNGYVLVEDAEGFSVCTCYGDQAASSAAIIVRALNELAGYRNDGDCWTKVE